MEAEAKAAFCEHKLSQLGVRPFVPAPVGVSVGTSPRASVAQGSGGALGLEQANEAEGSAEAYSVIQKQVKAYPACSRI